VASRVINSSENTCGAGARIRLHSGRPERKNTRSVLFYVSCIKVTVGLWGDWAVLAGLKVILSERLTRYLLLGLLITYAVAPPDAIALDRWLYIDKSGKEVRPPKMPNPPAYSSTDPVRDRLIQSSFTDGLAWFKTGKLFGYLNASERIVIPAQFTEAHPFSEGLAICRLPGETTLCVVDKNGQVKGHIPEQYVHSGDFSEGLARCSWEPGGKLSFKNAFIDRSAKLAFPQLDCVARDFSDGLALVDRTELGKNGYIDKFGKMRIDATFDRGLPFSEGLAGVEKDGHWFYINRSGKVVIKLPADCNSVRPFHEGLAAITLGGKFGTTTYFGVPEGAKLAFINKKGVQITNTRFPCPMLPHHFEFSDSLAAVPVEHNGYLVWGFIDKAGSFVIPPKYKAAVDFSDGVAKVCIGIIGFDAEDWKLRGKQALPRRATLLDLLLHDYKLVGMDQRQVLAILGAPDHTQSVAPDYDDVMYRLSSGGCTADGSEVQIRFVNGKVWGYRIATIGVNGTTGEWVTTNITRTGPIEFMCSDQAS
jgi:hypothetical protein